MNNLLRLMAAVSVLVCSSYAWAIVGETTINASDGGAEIPNAKISVTFKDGDGKTIRKIDTTNKKKIEIPDGTKKVDVVVTDKGKTRRQTDIDVLTFVGKEFRVNTIGDGAVEKGIDGKVDEPRRSTPERPKGANSVESGAKTAKSTNRTATQSKEKKEEQKDQVHIEFFSTRGHVGGGGPGYRD